MKPKTKIITGVVLLLFSFVIMSTLDVSAQSFPTIAYRETAVFGKGSAIDILWHPDGNSVLVSGSMGVWLYNSTLEPLARLEPLNLERVYALAQSPDGQRVAANTLSGLRSEVIYIWNRTTLALQTTIGPVSNDDNPEFVWSPDDSQIASIDWNNENSYVINIWNVANGSLAATLIPAEDDQLTHIAWSPDGTKIASAGARHTYIWSTQTHQLIGTLPVHRLITWSSDSILLAATQENSIYVWNTISMQTTRTFSHPSIVNALSWLPNSSNRLSSGDTNGTIKIWDLKSDNPLHTLTGHTAYIQQLAWSNNALYLVSTSRDGTLRVWNGTTWQLHRTFSGYHPLAEPDWHPDNQRIALAEGQNIRILNAVTGGIHAERTDHEFRPRSLAWNADGSRLATSDGESIRVRNASTGLLVYSVRDSTASFGGPVQWSPNGERLAAIGSPGGESTQYLNKRFIINANTGQILLTGEDIDTKWHTLDWSPDSQRVVFGSREGRMLVWNAETNEVFGIYGHKHRLRDVAWSPNGSKIASAGESPSFQVSIWNASDGAFLMNLDYNESVNEVAWRPDGNMLATISGYDHILLWDVLTGELYAELDWVDQLAGYSHLQWSTDGLTLTALNGNNTIVTWNVATRQVVEYGRPNIYFYDIAMYANGDKIAVADDRFLIHVLVREDRTTVSDVGNYVWHDSNGNGLQEAGEPGFQGVTVNLLRNNFSVAASTSTNSNGKYSFLDIPPGDYYIQIIPPADTYTIAPVDRGTDDTRDSDFDWRDNFGTPDPNDRVLRSMRFTASAGMQRDDLDAGFMPNSDLDVRVWRDTDGDGVQDTGEQGMAGVSLFLRRANFTRYRDPLTTDSNGLVTFANLPAGDYYVQINVPSGYSLAPFNIGPDDNIDNDFVMAFDYETGSGNVPRTLRFTLAPGVLRENIDAGLKQP